MGKARGGVLSTWSPGATVCNVHQSRLRRVLSLHRRPLSGTAPESRVCRVQQAYRVQARAAGEQTAKSWSAHPVHATLMHSYRSQTWPLCEILLCFWSCEHRGHRDSQRDMLRFRSIHADASSQFQQAFSGCCPEALCGSSPLRRHGTRSLPHAVGPTHRLTPAAGSGQRSAVG